MDNANPHLNPRKKRQCLPLTGGGMLREVLASGTLVLPGALHETRAQVAAARAGVAVEYARHASGVPDERPVLFRAEGI